ncbi:hypothetical protein FOL47_000599, partial [Perkinsus chesapeaki]
VKYYGHNLAEQRVDKCEDNPKMPRAPPHKYRSIVEVKKLPVGSFVDVRGILLTCSPLTEVHVSKTNGKKVKRNFSIIDQTEAIQITVWDEQAIHSIITPELALTHPTVAFKSVP